MQAVGVLVVADDLIWSSRLTEAVRRAGATVARTPDSTTRFALVDLNGRGYDGVEAVADAVKRGLKVLAVGQHEDLDLRKAALAACAVRVLSYNKLFSDGPIVVARLIEGSL